MSEKEFPVTVNHVNLVTALSKTEGKGLCEQSELPLLIPAYQRGYQWDTKDCLTLISSIFDVAFQNLEEKSLQNELNADSIDINQLISKSKYHHELSSWQYCVGTTKVNGDEKYQAKIIDGQQRLTTMLLLSRALLVTLCYLYDNPQTKPPGDLSSIETVAAELIRKLTNILQANKPRSATLSGYWGQLADVPVLNSIAIDDNLNGTMQEILKSGLKVPDFNCHPSDKYSSNYRLFLTLLAHPSLKKFYEASQDSTTEEKESKSQNQVDQKIVLPFKPWSDTSDETSASIQANLSGLRDLTHEDVKEFQNIFYANIEEGAWSKPTQTSLLQYISSADALPLEHIKHHVQEIKPEDGPLERKIHQKIPFILYFASTLLHNVRIILHRLATEESALKVFYLTNTAGHPLPRENIIRAELYQAHLESGQNDSQEKANAFVSNWNKWDLEISNVYAHRSDKALEKRTSEALLVALSYFNLTDFTYENSLDGAPGNLLRFGLQSWSRVQKVTHEHADDVISFLNNFKDLQAWTLLGEEPTWISTIITEPNQRKIIRQYLRVLNVLGEISVLQPVYLYLIHHKLNLTRANDHVIRFIKKHVANVLYRTVVNGNPLQDFSEINLSRDICGARYDREAKPDRSELVDDFGTIKNLNSNFVYFVEGNASKGKETTLIPELCLGSVKKGNPINKRLDDFDKYRYLSMAVNASSGVLNSHNLSEVSKAELDKQIDRLRAYLSTENDKTVEGLTFNHFLENNKTSYVRFVLFLLEVLSEPHNLDWDAYCSFVTNNAEANRVLKKQGDYLLSNDGKVVITEIEHISPREQKSNTSKDSEVFRTKWADHVNSLGNLALLEKEINASVGNDLVAKKDDYGKSIFPVAKSLSGNLYLNLLDFSKDNFSEENSNEARVDSQHRDVFETIQVRNKELTEILVNFFKEATVNYWGANFDTTQVKYHNRATKKSGFETIKVYSGKGERVSVKIPK